MNCPHCQTANPESAKFCMNCGTPLGTAKSGEAKSRFLDQYLPRNDKEAEANRSGARPTVERIGEGLREIGLRDSFLSRSPVQA